MRHLLRYIPAGDMIHEGAWGSFVSTIGLALVLLLLPVVIGMRQGDVFGGFGDPLINIVLFVSIYAVMALGLNVVVGYTGLLELGYITFFATGAFATLDMLLLKSTPDGLILQGVGTTVASDAGFFVFGWPFSYLLIMLISGLICAVLAVILRFPTLRLTGDYYAIVTLGLAEIVYLIYLNWTTVTGAAFGIKLPSEARPRLFGDEPLYYDSPQFYYLVLFVLGLTVVLMDRLSRSRVGRAWAAIRLDETAARACGINVNNYKIVAFAVSGFFGGVGGALYAVWSGNAAAKALDVWQSILILCAVVLGGMGSLRGVLLGSVILFSLREALREEISIATIVIAAVAIGGLIVVAGLKKLEKTPKRAAQIGIIAVLCLFMWLNAGPKLRVPPEASFLVYGLLLVFVMRFRPQGLLPRGKGETTPMSKDEEDDLRRTSHRLYAMKEAK